MHADDYTGLSIDRTSAIIYVYHRIDEDQYPDTNIMAEQFIAQIDEITNGDYNVKSLPDIIGALENKTNLPERTIALTFDGAYKSFMDTAYPLLEKHELPYTVFISTNHIDAGNPQHLSWSDLRKIRKSDLATIGLMPASYTRIYKKPENEIRRQINKAKGRYRTELNEEALYFAYPFGEYNAAYKDIIKQSGFKAAFGQQSSVVYSEDDLYELPRFAMTETFGNISRFRLTANALPLTGKVMRPKSHILSSPLQSVTFKVNDDIDGSSLEPLSCFFSGAGKAELEITEDNTITATLDYPVESERIRMNCTLPLPTVGNLDEKRWRWYGELFIYPRETTAGMPLRTPSSGENSSDNMNE